MYIPDIDNDELPCASVGDMGTLTNKIIIILQLSDKLYLIKPDLMFLL